MFPGYRESRLFVPAACSATRISKPEIDLRACESLRRPVGGWRLRDNAIQSGWIRLRGNRLPRPCRVWLFPAARQHFDLDESFAPLADPRSQRRVGSCGSEYSRTKPPGSPTAEKVFWPSRSIPAPCGIHSSSASLTSVPPAFPPP